MLQRPLNLPPEYVYPPDDWNLVEERFYPRLLGQAETLFALSNGYIGIRGTPEEGEPVYRNGTFVNGFHETWPIVYGEEAHGFAKLGQTMLNVTDATLVRLYVDDEPFYLPTAHLVRYRRTLSLREGLLRREIVWEMPSGLRVAIRSTRLVSFIHRHVAAVVYEVTLLNGKAPVVLSAELRGNQSNQAGKADPRQGRGFAGRVLHPRGQLLRERRIILSHATERSGMALAVGAEHHIATECAFTEQGQVAEESGALVFSVNAEPGVPIRLTKLLAYHTSRRATAEELVARTERTLDRVTAGGIDDLMAGQYAWLAEFWKQADVEVETEHPRVQQVMRWNLFQLAQASACVGVAGIAAKALTGQTYEGHYFWDTEIYALPFLIYTQPRIARNLLKFRHYMLDKARQRAREVNQAGALFPWRTINGEEASAYYAAGTAQYHINADIVYALRKYVEVTGDREFLRAEGAEMLVETARLWRDIGFFSRHRDGRFCIHAVTGPDEYNTVVDNNTFTNLMARDNLRCAAAAAEALRTEYPQEFAALHDRTRLDPAEVAEWRRAADRMYIPYDEALGIHPQDDDFLGKKPWDFAGTPPDRYPLLLHYHPLVIYRHQVIKQADIVLAMFLLSREFSLEQKRRNFDFYDPLTTGDSSLSVCIQGIVAAEIGYLEKAFEYFQYGLLMDVADVAGNVKDGVHLATAGGTWMGIVYGFAGMRDEDGRLRFSPRLPSGIRRLAFRLLAQGRRLEVELSPAEARYTLLEGDAFEFEHQGRQVALSRPTPTASLPLVYP